MTIEIAKPHRPAGINKCQKIIKLTSNSTEAQLPTCLELRVVASEGAIHRRLIGRARRLHRHVYQPPPPRLIDPRTYHAMCRSNRHCAMLW
jgi:hypothetical protein